MDHLIRILLEHLSFLYKDHGFRIIDSLHTASFGGNGLIVLTDGIVIIRLTRDREQHFCHFKAHKDRHKKLGWYSIDIVRRFLTSEDANHTFLDSDNLQFVKDRLTDIRMVFEPTTLAETQLELKAIRRKRMKEMWR